MMGQVGHIFRKDVRRHWREIAVSLAVLAAFAWKESRRWTGEPADLSPFLLALLTTLVPISWSFLIVRVVQDECLVGDRQFWITRPYEWKKLLAAKLLFVLVFVNIPLLALDIVLLLNSGFMPSSYLAGLLWLQLLWTLYLILPSATAGSGHLKHWAIGLGCTWGNPLHHRDRVAFLVGAEYRIVAG
jgi:hypothetical protein